MRILSYFIRKHVKTDLLVCLIEKPFRKSLFIYFLLSTSSVRSLAPLDKVERKSDFVTSRLACIVSREKNVKTIPCKLKFVRIMLLILQKYLYLRLKLSY